MHLYVYTHTHTHTHMTQGSRQQLRQHTHSLCIFLAFFFFRSLSRFLTHTQTHIGVRTTAQETARVSRVLTLATLASIRFIFCKCFFQCSENRKYFPRLMLATLASIRYFYKNISAKNTLYISAKEYYMCVPLQQSHVYLRKRALHFSAKEPCISTFLHKRALYIYMSPQKTPVYLHVTAKDPCI